jgi:hypothetical protein
MKPYDKYIAHEEIKGALDELDHEAFKGKMRSRRRRNGEGEAQWQFYRDALFNIAKELKINWKSKH